MRVLVFAALAASCAGAQPRWPDAWLAREGERFIAGDRRAALDASLVNPDNLYSQQRLGAYALGDRGWDLLPEWNPRSAPLSRAFAEALERAEMPSLALPLLWDGGTPSSPAEWIALGRRVFFEYPMRPEVFIELGLTQRAVVDAVGVERTAEGDVPGLVVFRDVDGETRAGITCAICHSAVEGGAVVAGRARRSFDYGRLRAWYYGETGEPVDPAQLVRMASWGPGRADVTEDDDEDPVTIPDLWGLRAQPWLTSAGTIRHADPLALAIRQESQLVDASLQRVRPPRVLVWALVMYLYALEPPPARDAAASPRGAELFATHCASCHSNAAYGGDRVAAAVIGTNGALATGRGRGTGYYRVPPLLRVSAAAPYLHDGSVPTLEALLSRDRAAPGHLAGTELSASDKAALIAFLARF